MKPKPGASLLLQCVEDMPPCRHWPYQDQPFDINDSEVVRWLSRQPDVQQWLFNTMKSRGLIVFDQARGTWRGNGKR